MSINFAIPEDQAKNMIEEEIKQQYKDVTNFRYKKVGEKFLDGDTYYVEYITPDLSKADSFYYAYINAEGCTLFENGDQAIVHMQTLLDKRKNFLQRLRDFDFLDIIGAIIALPIIFAFIYIVVAAKGDPNAVSKEFLTIVSLILGYYFGRNKTK